ncbi:SAM-dependent methyltransferase [Spongiactinospora sp. TRM90649]|uniref:SAM-dependent methyltransferase n=1 Tax=Spongiactinospora sp. TRM90649 TaxID=3031114 RepID=UPI0023F76331|nr:SAM-dependent methyltransferase [Spongiactinospora sp. TRM90649]MDF5758262.1 SAM-dependent methyltransferase [Spongiactinospora sp. TRM90649]
MPDATAPPPPGPSRRSEINTSVAHPARIYDYYLGGKDNFAADRVAGEAMIAATRGGVRAGARQNRAFLVRAVRELAEAGVEQFLDIGTGIPTSPNVHEVARAVRPGARVAYVDNDPIVLVHARALMSGGGAASIIQADLRRPETILDDTRVRDTIDFRKPVAVLFVAVLQFCTDAEDPHGVVARLMDAVPSGSHLALSHFTADFNPEAAAKGASSAYDKATAPLIARDHAEVSRFFDGLDLLPPGVVQASHWRPDGEVPEIPGGHPWVWAGIGVKP